MPQNAWSLLVFTLLTQMSVGAFCLAELINLSYSKEFSSDSLNHLRLSSRLFVLVAMLFAGVSSIFHLKNWANAFRAFNNLKTSWVSKEMALFFLFIFCVATLTLVSWRKIKGYFLQCLISIAGALGGFAMIYSMAKIYMLPTIPTWDSWITPGLYFTSAILLGTMAIVFLYTSHWTSPRSTSLEADGRERWNKKTFPALLKLLMFVIPIGILMTGFFAYRLFMVAKEYSVETAVINPDGQWLLLLRIILFVFGWIFIFLELRKTRQIGGIQDNTRWFVYGAAILVVLAEIVGRYLFFVSYTRIGV